MNEPQQAAGYHYRQVPNLYRAVADVTMEFERSNAFASATSAA